MHNVCQIDENVCAHMCTDIMLDKRSLKTGSRMQSKHLRNNLLLFDENSFVSSLKGILTFFRYLQVFATRVLLKFK